MSTGIRTCRDCGSVLSINGVFQKSSPCFEMTDEEIDKYMGVKRKLYTLADVQAAREEGRQEVERRYTPSATAYIKELERAVARYIPEGSSFDAALTGTETRAEIEVRVLERCIGAVNNERLLDPQSGTGDEAYNQAIDDAMAALRALGGKA